MKAQQSVSQNKNAKDQGKGAAGNKSSSRIKETKNNSALHQQSNKISSKALKNVAKA
jgi:hypothetical protein